MASAASIDWEELKRKLPYEKTAEAYKKRIELFRNMDASGNHYLSLAEVQTGLLRILGSDGLFDAKPAIARAFHAAKFYRPSDPTGPGADYVQRKEFRVLLQSLHIYFGLWVIFEKLDSSEDKRVSLDEFKRALPKLKEWGVDIAASAAEAVFKQINGSLDGHVLFAEFCSWAMKQRRDNCDDDDKVLEELNVQDRVMQDFQKWDLNNDGSISRDELWTVFSKLDASVTEAELDQILEVADFNKDGKISYKEFVCWLFSGGQNKQAVTEAFVKAALMKRGFDDQRVLEGLMLAFDHDNSGNLSTTEFNGLLSHVDEMLARPEVVDDVPPDCKAFIRLADTGKGPYEKKGNPNLKMLLTSAGIMPKSTQDLKDAYKKLKAKTPGKGIMYLVDARMVKLQFHLLNANPEKHNQQASVPYRRTPDAPGGKPTYDSAGKLVMKSQEELMNMGREGYAGVPYNLRKRGHYANADLAEMADATGETPVYVAYLYYNGEVVNGEPQYTICMGRGDYENGVFTAYNVNGKDFTEDDYNTPCTYSNKGDHFFEVVSDSEFQDVMNDTQVVYGTGGIPFIPILHFQPYFVDKGQALKHKVNPYGKCLLDNIKAGNVLYVGMSAGAMSFGWTLGPLTSDPDSFMLHDAGDGDMEAVDLGQSGDLGKIWLFPGLGEYVGMPYDITFKVHVHFNHNTCSYGGTAHKAEKVAKVVSAIAQKDKYCALLCDYDWYAGQGDALEVLDGRLFYHVGYSEVLDTAPAEHLPKLQKLGLKGDKLPRQPPGNPKTGFHFEWTPSKGEVIAAGPKSTRPFHMYASSNGMLTDANPAYPYGADVNDDFVKEALRKRGITDNRTLQGLSLAFDKDDSGCLSAAELDDMLNHVDRIMEDEEENGPDESPPDIKAFVRLADTKAGPYMDKGNPKLKMLLTSAGIMAASTPDLKNTLNRLKAETPGNGVMYLVDARLSKLQFHLLHADPSKHNDSKNVAYKREPDAPGGKPVYDSAKKLVMKSQAELQTMGQEGYAGVPYNLRTRGHYANGSLEAFCGTTAPETPVYVAYLWYSGEVKNGEPVYGIFLGKGVYRNGKFVAFKTDGSEFTEDDYNTPCLYSGSGDHFFSKVSGDEIAKTIGSVQVCYATGGIPYLPIMHFQPYFVDNGKHMLDKPNPYGKALLDNIKEGNIVYVGMSAGAMAWGWTLGPLTSDPDNFMLHDADDGEAEAVDFGQGNGGELGKLWLFPGLGKYVGIPYDLTLKVHVHFDAAVCSYGGTAHKAEKVAKIISGIAKQDKYCCLLSDYDWYTGQGDALEVSGSKLHYHVGHHGGVETVTKDALPRLQAAGCKDTTLPRQPPGNSAEGWSFVWNPTKGEVIAAGPKAKKPFHMYASSDGPLPGVHPAYPKGVELSEEYAIAQLQARGLTDKRVLEGLTLAFDADDSGTLSQAEYNRMIEHVDQILDDEDEVDDGVPPDAKAFIRLADTKNGVYDKPGNPNLKMLLTSSGIMPMSTPDLKDTLDKLKSQTQGKGVLYLVDARMSKLQFHLLHADPAKHNHSHSVAYRRAPDHPGGKPVRDASGKVVLKSQEELMNMGEEGYAGVPYNLRKRGHYANGHLHQFAGTKGEVPVYVAYLWYNGEILNGEPQYEIFVGKGCSRDGNFTAFHSKTGQEFTEADYNTPCEYSRAGDHFFGNATGEEWGKIVGECQVCYATGGIPYLPIFHFQPYFIDNGKQMKNKPNPYGMHLLENMKAGNIVYVGMSAGAMAWSWSMGPLTTDPDKFMMYDADGDGAEEVDFGQNSELGKFWLFPGLGKYVGIPYDLTLKVHVHFSAANMSYGGTAMKAEKVAKVISGVAHQDHYSALLSDYDWYKGQGDALEVRDGKLFYHVGYTARTDPVPEKFKAQLATQGYKADTMPRQPSGNPAEGWSFEWSPNDGEFIAAGPKATKKPFKMYASSEGILPDAHPAFSR